MSNNVSMLSFMLNVKRLVLVGNRGTTDIVTIEPFAFHDLLWSSH